MNRRIRRKQLAKFDAMIADGLRLYATRPSGGDYEEIARGLLGLQICLALYQRYQLLRGPHRGWGVGPPDSLQVVHADERSLTATGRFLLLPPGDRPDVPQAFRLSAQRSRRGWRHVILTFE